MGLTLVKLTTRNSTDPVWINPEAVIRIGGFWNDPFRSWLELPPANGEGEAMTFEFDYPVEQLAANLGATVVDRTADPEVTQL